MSARVAPWRRSSQARSWIACAFRGGLATGRRGGEEGVDVGVASEVADDGSDGADMELEPLGELFGGGTLEEVGAADLVAALGRRVGLLEEAREFLGSGHRCWVPNKQVVIGQGMQRGGAKIRAQGNVGWGEKQGRRGFGGDAEVKMGEERRRGGAEIAQGLAYIGTQAQALKARQTPGKSQGSSGRN